MCPTSRSRFSTCTVPSPGDGSYASNCLAGPAFGGAGCAIHPPLSSRLGSSRRAGQIHEHLLRPDRPSDVGAADRPETARHAGRHADHLGRRIRSDPDVPGQRAARVETITSKDSRCGWPAAGFKPRHSHGATDELGYHAVEDVVHVRDLHATMLHLLGIDHRRFTYKFQGLDMRLTGVEPAHVVDEILT